MYSFPGTVSSSEPIYFNWHFWVP